MKLINNRRSLRTCIIVLTTLIFCVFSYNRILAFDGNSNLIKKQNSNNISKPNLQKLKTDSKGENKNSKVQTNNEKDSVPAVSEKKINNLLILPAVGTISSPFGYRKLTMNDGSVSTEIHKGIDIAAPMGNKICAALSGTVTFAGIQQGYGNTIIISHANGMETLYGHCSKLEVNVGDRVEAKQEIGKVGSTGRSTGPHVHFEVRINGNAVNPMDYIQKGCITSN